jgi:beta-lactamase regulating signal transducer with metallopeptidase domain
LIAPLHLQTIAEASATRLVECLVEGTLIALCAALLLRLRRRHSSGTRFAVWFSALMAIAALPFLAGILVSMSSSIETLRGTTSAALHDSAITLPASWALYLFSAWAIVALVSLSRLVVSLRGVRALRKRCIAIDPAQLDPLLRQTLENARVPHSEPARSEVEGRFSLGGKQEIALCTSDQVQVPTAIGFFQPAVVIPAWLLEDLSPEELNQILLHELAHLRRRDDWTNLAQQIVKALFFFHPAVWWIERKLSLEREMACDDAVLAATAKPHAYAECLTHLAERTFIRRTLIERGIKKGITLAQAALGRVRHMSLRVAEILSPNRQRTPKPVWKPALSLIAAFAVGSVVFASREPQLVAFQDASTQVAPRSGSHFNPSLAAMTSSRNPGLKPIPASFVTAQAPALKKLLHPRPSDRELNKETLIKAALNQAAPNKATLNQTSAFAPRTERPDTSTFASALIIEAPIASSTLVHLTSTGEASTVSTQTVLLLVEHRQSGQAGQSVYQIQMWRLTVLPSALPAAGKQLPRKET